MKILITIRSLHIGGSERQVVALTKSMAAQGNEIHVATFVSGGPLENDLSGIPNVNIHSLDRSGLVGKFKLIYALRSLIKSNEYNAVYGFLPTPNLALLVARTIRRRPFIAWGVRSSDLDLTQYSSKVKWAMRLEKWLSRFIDRVITNSQAALDEYREIGYPYSKLAFIPNAIDVDRFRPNPNARKSVRNTLGISEDAPVIGIFARIHPMKDHETFLKAAKILLETTPLARFICAGGTSSGDSNHEQKIKALSAKLGLNDSVLWLGARNDPEDLMTACDLTTLTSISGEGFPNSVAESMACSVTCVVTDVGDAGAIASTYGAIVQPENPEQLAAAWKTTLERNQDVSLKQADESRSSIIERYLTVEIARNTLALLTRN